MRKLIATIAPMLLVWTTLPVHSHAQLFGTRQLGTPLSRGTGSSQFSQAGQIQGSERFLRTNRRRADFVGSDRADRSSFVGNQQASVGGNPLASTTAIAPPTDRSAQINQPLKPAEPNAPYPPRLQIGFAVPAANQHAVADRLTAQLVEVEHFSPHNRVEVLVAGRTATLRGVVADARERDLVELWVSFEPGISAVKNELRTRPQPPPEGSRAATQR